MKLSDIKNFVQGYYNKIRDTHLNSLDSHIKEQALYRASLCSDCLEKGKCKVCGCNTPAMFYSPSKKDSEGKWGKMLQKDKWEQFKKDNNINTVLFKTFEDMINDKLNLNYLKPSMFVQKGMCIFSKMDSTLLLELDYAIEINANSVDYKNFNFITLDSKSIIILSTDLTSICYLITSIIRNTGLNITLDPLPLENGSYQLYIQNQGINPKFSLKDASI